MATLLMHAVEQGLAYGIAALGVFLTYRILQFPDLTVDGSFVTGAAIASILILNGGDPFLAIAAAFVAGAVAGLITGFLNARLGVTNLLAGVLAMIMLYSINLRVMGRPNLSLLRASTAMQVVDRAWSPLGPLAILAFIGLLTLVVKLGVDLFLKTELGFALRATGDSEAMVGAHGVDVRTMKMVGLALSNGLVALSGALVAQYGGFADVGMGIGTIVTGLAAVILGGSLIRSRRVGWMTTAVLAGSIAYRIAVAVALRYGYVVGFQASDLKLITALLVLLALIIPALRERQLRKVSSC
ncbi:MAG: ABC transporter permease [Candidatus Bipolaricaulota bacterium]|nr:ABC transporter permease [Candidatus Bipolaricaulota bacterium]